MNRYLLCGLLAILANACEPSDQQHPGTPVRIRWAHDPESLDPLAPSTQNALDATNLLHLGLLQADFQSRTFAPALAEALPQARFIGDSLTQLDYHLRAAATWDDGHPVLATDVAFTLKLIYCPGLLNGTNRIQLSFIRQLIPDPTDPRHFTLVCRGQSSDYSWLSGEFPVLPEASLDPTHSLRPFSLATLQHQLPGAAVAPPLAALARRYQQADLSRHPEHVPGCGPYQLATWQPNRYLTFQRKPAWWADKLRPAPFVLQARATALQYIILPSAAAATLALRRHELDVYPQITARDFQRLQASPVARQELAFYTSDSYDVVTAGFNTRRNMFRDKLTRQALSRLFDASLLLTATQLGRGRRTVGLLAPGSPYYCDSLPLPAYAPAQAEALLRRAGWHRPGAAGSWQRPPATRRGETTQRLALTVSYRADESSFETIALQFRAAAAQVGISVSLRPLEPSVLTESLQKGDFDLYIRTLKGNPFGTNFAPVLSSKAIGSGNFTGFGSPATDRLLDEIATTRSEPRKRRLLWRFQWLLQDEAPLVPLFFLPFRLVAARQLRVPALPGIKPGFAAAALVWADSSQPAASPQ